MYVHRQVTLFTIHMQFVIKKVEDAAMYVMSCHEDSIRVNWYFSSFMFASYPPACDVLSSDDPILFFFH